MTPGSGKFRKFFVKMCYNNFLRDGFTLQHRLTLTRGPREVYLKKLS